MLEYVICGLPLRLKPNEARRPSNPLGYGINAPTQEPIGAADNIQTGKKFIACKCMAEGGKHGGSWRG